MILCVLRGQRERLRGGGPQLAYIPASCCSSLQTSQYMHVIRCIPMRAGGALLTASETTWKAYAKFR